MPAAPERTVLASIPDAPDREVRVSLIRWSERPDFGLQAEIADYIPSRDLYGRGYLFDPRHTSKVIAGLRATDKAAKDALAQEIAS